MRRIRVGLVPLAILLASCTSGRTSSDGPTDHGDTARSGSSHGSASATPASATPHRRAWERRLDAAVYAQPVVVGKVVIAATENNTVYALRADSGAVVWRRHLAPPIRRDQLPCGNIDPLGITGTPAYDVKRDSVFVVTETTDGRHDLHALDARSGRLQWTRNLDVVDRDRTAQQQRAALLVAHDKVYVAFGGLFGDCGDYIGYVTSVATDGRGAVDHYAVPSGREAGIWAARGPVLDPTTGDILVAVGNGSEAGGSFDGSDSVVRLSPTLTRVGFFAPSTWPADNAADLDLGSMSPVVAGNRIVIAGKRGTVYLLRHDLGGIGGQVATLDGCAAYGGGAGTGSVVVLPCSDGIRRLDVRGNSMRWGWHVAGVAGSPLIVGDVVYSLAQNSGDLYAVDLRTGRVRSRVHVGEVTRFATPAPTHEGLVIGTTTGVVALRGN